MSTKVGKKIVFLTILLVVLGFNICYAKTNKKKSNSIRQKYKDNVAIAEEAARKFNEANKQYNDALSEYNSLQKHLNEVQAANIPGQLMQIENSLYYQFSSGGLATSQWILIDIDGDLLHEWYYFGSDGKLQVNTITPDGCNVNEKGQYNVNGQVVLEDLVSKTSFSSDDNFMKLSVGGGVVYAGPKWINGGDAGDIMLNSLALEKTNINKYKVNYTVTEINPRDKTKKCTAYLTGYDAQGYVTEKAFIYFNNTDTRYHYFSPTTIRITLEPYN